MTDGGPIGSPSFRQRAPPGRRPAREKRLRARRALPPDRRRPRESARSSSARPTSRCQARPTCSSSSAGRRSPRRQPKTARAAAIRPSCTSSSSDKRLDQGGANGLHVAASRRVSGSRSRPPAASRRPPPGPAPSARAAAARAAPAADSGSAPGRSRRRRSRLPRSGGGKPNSMARKRWRVLRLQRLQHVLVAGVVGDHEHEARRAPCSVSPVRSSGRMRRSSVSGCSTTVTSLRASTTSSR